MGVSTNAILAYGYNLSDGDDWNVEETDEYGGLDVDWCDPDSDSSEANQLRRRLLVASGFTETWEDGNEGYFAREREAKEALGVELETYCSDDSPMRVLAAHVVTVRRGYIEELDLASLMAQPAENGWDEKLTAALSALGLTPKQDGPRWLLCSYWG